MFWAPESASHLPAGKKGSLNFMRSEDVLEIRALMSEDGMGEALECTALIVGEKQL